ncbi:hypothetical protein VOLCADRAFT_108482 [Volvox carteri f. nagariensis]|uniref:Uncharacterized protein n=1 Tax=Volvox carteri f. nagariensis TaxID=3068 RepID=D8UKD6_VOLCA|nr:uncharacterized protein VOLCADRAFT_108482 [Volvox carteri f. nagariensis]EFJ39816.1 hypothetical protein VOLCADRAFT_108482 [Volvox carteri f. nagariensis]|eukprot:XP_002959117.1 hypothetical protein VOLCADRAFT_108482 [Volvox carteri f. nagariensis]
MSYCETERANLTSRAWLRIHFPICFPSDETLFMRKNAGYGERHIPHMWEPNQAYVDRFRLLVERIDQMWMIRLIKPPAKALLAPTTLMMITSQWHTPGRFRPGSDLTGPVNEMGNRSVGLPGEPLSVNRPQ